MGPSGNLVGIQTTINTLEDSEATQTCECCHHELRLSCLECLARRHPCTHSFLVVDPGAVPVTEGTATSLFYPSLFLMQIEAIVNQTGCQCMPDAVWTMIFLDCCRTLALTSNHSLFKHHLLL